MKRTNTNTWLATKMTKLEFYRFAEDEDNAIHMANVWVQWRKALIALTLLPLFLGGCSSPDQNPSPPDAAVISEAAAPATPALDSSVDSAPTLHDVTPVCADDAAGCSGPVFPVGNLPPNRNQ